MPNMTIRLPEDMWRRMKEKSDINWTEVARNAFRSHLDRAQIPSNVENLVRGLCEAEEWDKLLCLYMKAEWVKADYILKNLALIYGEEASKTLHETEAKLREVGLDPSLSGTTEDGKSISAVIKDALLTTGAYDKLEGQCRVKLEKASWEVKEAAWLMSQYFIKDTMPSYEYRMSLVPDGFERTLEIMLGRTDLLEELVKLGLVFKNLYWSKAYLHEEYIGAEYARPIFEELSTQKDFAVIASLYELERSQDFRAFLSWLGKEGGESRMITPYEEEKCKLEFTGATKPFDELLKDLVKRYLVMVDFLPARSRVGKRQSRPPYWIFRLTPSAKRHLVPHLLKMLAERQ